MPQPRHVYRFVRLQDQSVLDVSIVTMAEHFDRKMNVAQWIYLGSSLYTNQAEL